MLLYSHSIHIMRNRQQIATADDDGVLKQLLKELLHEIAEEKKFIDDLK